jgi:hypothetical protein
MGKRRSNRSVTAEPTAGAPTGITGSVSPQPIIPPSDPPSSSNSLFLILSGVGLLAVIGLIAVVWSRSFNDDDHPDPTKPKVQKGKWEVVTADDGVCDSFVRQRKAAEPGANDLLGPAPVVPDRALTADEADSLQAEFFLRDDLWILEIRKTQIPNRYCFVSQGNVAAPRLEVRRNNDVTSEQRTMSNPDLYVEVRDGKIYGVRATLHRD